MSNLNLLTRLRGIVTTDEATVLDGLLRSPAATKVIEDARAQRVADRDKAIADLAQLETDEVRDLKPVMAAREQAVVAYEVARKATDVAFDDLARAHRALRATQHRFEHERGRIEASLRTELADPRIEAYRAQLTAMSDSARKTGASRSEVIKPDPLGDGYEPRRVPTSNGPAFVRHLQAVNSAILAVPELYRVPSAKLDREIAKRLAAIPAFDPDGGFVELK